MMRRDRTRTRLAAKEPAAAMEALAEAWGSIAEARKALLKAEAAIGKKSRWSVPLSRTFIGLHEITLRLEDMREEIKQSRALTPKQ